MTSIVVAVSAIASGSAAAAAVAGLIIMLVTRELVDASERPYLKLVANRLAVFAVPLLIVFVFIVIIATVKIA